MQGHDFALQGMKNVGGTFPVGEVFTEPKELRQVNGEVRARLTNCGLMDNNSG